VVFGAPTVKTKFAASMVYKEYKTQTLAEIDFAALAAMPRLGRGFAVLHPGRTTDHDRPRSMKGTFARKDS
jgi:hypothetical protein